MTIRTKLILMLAIPLAALAMIGAIGFRAQSSTAREVSAALDNDAVVQSINTAIKTIGAERLAVADGTARWCRGVSGCGANELEGLRETTDASIAEITERANEAGQSSLVAQAVAEATGEVGRGRTTSALLTSIINYNTATEALRGVRDRIPVDYPSQGSFAEATAVNLAVDIADRQDVVWLEYIGADAADDELIDKLQAEFATGEVLREQIVEIAPSSHYAPLNASLASEMDANIDRARSEAITRFGAGESTLPDAQTLETVVASHDDWYLHATMLQDEVRHNLEDRANAAENSQNLFALLGTLGLVILFGLIYMVYRSVVRPLEDLLVGAEEISTERLPAIVAELRTIGSDDDHVHIEPLARESDDELGSLVDAFNNVQLTAFDLAVEQARSRRNTAEMFVNLGRRNQKLLQRMLGMISDLERSEQDPAKLEQLFQLDHMTTRMRRNAESLLVVAGTTSPRQWAKPVPADEVVRSALAEVQEYQRVDVLDLADAPLPGNAVADVTHLLAELLDNSLQFSDPGSRVTISSRWKNDDYRIIINDKGFGLTAEELEQHNDLISNPPPPDQAPTRFLGLFVVGHLAKRHGIAVELVDASHGGTDARILIPGSLINAVQAPEGAPAELYDLDAELAILTAESDAQRQAGESVADELPVRGEVVADELPTRGEVVADELPTRGEVVADELPTRGEVVADELPTRGEVVADELPTRDEPVAHVMPPAEPAPELPVRGEVVADELPTRGEPVARVMPPAEPAPELPVRRDVVPDVMPETPAEMVPAMAAAPIAGDLAARTQQTPIDFGLAPDLPHFDPAVTPTTKGLPTRTPQAALPEPGAVAVAPTGAFGAAATREPEDVVAKASTVSSTLSAFQSGVQRGERTTNQP